MVEQQYDILLIVCNRGFSRLVLDIAERTGAIEGKCMISRGELTREVQKIFGISIPCDKESILILVNHSSKRIITDEIFKWAGLSTDANGLIFSLSYNEAIVPVNLFEKI